MDVHPLLLPEVLTTIFHHLPPKDLFTCRLVHPSWRNESNPLIAQKIKTTITNDSHFTNILDFTKHHPNHPYRTFELQDIRISLDVPLVEEFFSVCGPYIHHLAIWYNREADDWTISIRTFRDLLIYYVPNLKSLSIQHLPYSIFSKPHIFPPVGYPDYFRPALRFLKSLTIFSDLNLHQSFLEDLLSLSNSIESITIKFGIPPGDFKKKLIRAMINKSANLKNLQSFKYFMHDLGGPPGEESSWNEEECKVLGSRWSLNTLKLNPTSDGFSTLMNSLLKSSLSKLTIRVHHPLSFPYLPTLTHLTLYDYEENLTFLENLPNLKYLGLCEYFPSKTITTENILRSQSNLTSLNLYGSTIPDHLFKKLISCLRNLRSLNLWHCTKKKFRSVVKNARLLEELVINVANMDDEALTGISCAVCEQIERRLKNCDDDGVDKVAVFDGGGGGGVLEMRKKVFVGDLKNLQRLEIHGACLADWRWNSVGDVSAIFGIACVPNLTSLLIKEFKWITEDSIKTIIKSTPLQQLKFDPREFAESLESEIRLIRPDIRLEYATDDYEQYVPRGMHSINSGGDENNFDSSNLFCGGGGGDFVM